MSIIKMTISEQENELFMEWQDHLKSRLDKDIVDNIFCLDGLHFTGTPFIDNFGNWQMKRDYKEEELWRNSKIKCLFLTKDHNLQGDSEGVDIRFETGLKNMSGNSVDTAKIYHSFYGRYFLLLRGILSLNNNIIPESRPEYINKARENAKFFWESPVCRINLKKIAGGNFCDNNILNEYIKNDFEYIKRQIQIYNANVIICCQGSDWDYNNPTPTNPIMTMLKKIYPDLQYYRNHDLNKFVYYSEESNIIVLHEWHMSFRVSYTNYFRGALELANFIKETSFFKEITLDLKR